MAWRFTPDKPVFIQIGEQIKRSVVSGEYAPGTQIPTVRQIAADAAVNPNTVQHAFSMLETEGIIISKGTIGKFVTEDEEILKACRKSMAKKLSSEFLTAMKELAFSAEDALAFLSAEKDTTNELKEDNDNE